MSALSKDTSYFELDADEAPSFYQSVMAIVKPSQLAAAVLAMFVLQLVITIIALHRDTTSPGALGEPRRQRRLKRPRALVSRHPGKSRALQRERRRSVTFIHEQPCSVPLPQRSQVSLHSTRTRRTHHARWAAALPSSASLLRLPTRLRTRAATQRRTPHRARAACRERPVPRRRARRRLARSLVAPASQRHPPRQRAGARRRARTRAAPFPRRP